MSLDEIINTAFQDQKKKYEKSNLDSLFESRKKQLNQQLVEKADRVEKKRGFLEKTADFLGMSEFGKGLGQAVFTQTAEGREFLGGQEEQQKRIQKSMEKIKQSYLEGKIDKEKYQEILQRNLEAEGLQGKAIEEWLQEAPTEKQFLASAGMTGLGVVGAGSLVGAGAKGMTGRLVSQQAIGKFGQQALKTGVRGLAKEGAKYGGAYGVLGAYGEERNIIEGVISGALTGAVAGPLIGKVAVPAVQKIISPVVKAVTPIEQQITQKIRTGVEKGIKPYFGAKTTMAQQTRYMQNAETAIKTINDMKPIFEQEGIKITRNPQNRRELLEAIDQTKSGIYRAYNSLAQKAGKEGVKFDTSKVTKELNKVSKDLSYSPQLRRYADDMIEEISELQGASPEIIQERIKDLNESLASYYAGRTDKAKARLDASVSNLIREELDNKITSATGTEYQALRNKYAALKTIEKDVARQVNLEARKASKGLLDFTDIFTGSDIVGGLINLSPAQVARGMAGRGIKEVYKYLNDPNRFIKQMFQDIEKLSGKISKELTGKTGKIILKK